MEAFDKVPDTVGTGKYPALKEESPALPNHVIYRPADLSKLGDAKLGVLAWGKSGCAADGAGSRLHLAEIASHGYLAIANGKIMSGPGAAPRPKMPAFPPNSPPPGSPGFHPPPPATSAAGLREAIDWALAENGRAGSPYFGRINPRWIAVSGARLRRLAGARNCGRPSSAQRYHPQQRHLRYRQKSLFPASRSRKDALAKLHSPTIYILGGESDIAYANGMDDFKKITTVPVMVANLDVGHGGTFMEPDGGREASVAVSWLDWTLKGDAELAAKRFTGPDCGLCTDAAWKVERKNFQRRLALGSRGSLTRGGRAGTPVTARSMSHRRCSRLHTSASSGCGRE